jgi:hypothetical protein
MSLFDKLKDTKFKSLKFGNDKPGGGTSSEPIIQKPIKDNNLVGMEKTVADTAAENKDRISRLIKSTPRGINFINKQSGLQLSNTRLELPKGNIFGVGINTSTRLTPLTFYNKETLLAQEGGNIGDHFDRFGLTPFMEDSYKYINIATSNNTTKNNRLVGLQNKLETKYYKLTPGASITPSSINILKSKVKSILGGISTFTNTLAGISNIFGGSPFLNSLNNKISGISRLVSPFLSPTIDQYIGGPGSKFGIGTTNIRRFDFTNDLDKFRAVKEFSDTGARNGRVAYTSSSLYGASDEFNSSPFVDEGVVNEPPKSPINSQFQRLQKQKNKTIKSFNKSETGNLNNGVYQNTIYQFNRAEVYLDKANKDFKYFGNNKQTLNSFNRNDGENMSVVFQLINPFDGKDLHRIVFSAYINGFKVNSDATWNNISYIGRSEDLYVYSKYKRTASFNLQIPCFNIIELREKHRALGALESSLAGMYGPIPKDNNPPGNKLGGILTKLYLGNYLRGEVGIINSISYDIPNDSSWDLEEQLAHNINVSINFTIIHDVLPTFNKDGGFLTHIKEGVKDKFITSQKALTNAGIKDGTLNPSNFINEIKPSNIVRTETLNLTNQSSGLFSSISTLSSTPLRALPSNLQTQLENKIQPLPR